MAVSVRVVHPKSVDWGTEVPCQSPNLVVNGKRAKFDPRDLCIFKMPRMNPGIQTPPPTHPLDPGPQAPPWWACETLYHKGKQRYTHTKETRPELTKGNVQEDHHPAFTRAPSAGAPEFSTGMCCMYGGMVCGPERPANLSQFSAECLATLNCRFAGRRRALPVGWRCGGRQ